jgi:predicted porin
VNSNFLKFTFLATTALSFISTSAVAEVSLSGSHQFHFVKQDSGSSISGASNDYFDSQTVIDFIFTNKTDSGLTIQMNHTLKARNQNTTSTFGTDGANISIEGGFGTITLGEQAGIGDSTSVTAADLIGPGSTDGKAPSFYSSSGSLTSQQASLINIIDTENSITYSLPKIGGVTFGASYKDAGSGTANNDNETVIAGSYEFTSGDVSGSVVYANNSIDGTTAGAGSLNSTSLGLAITFGPISAIIAQAEDDQSTSIQTEVNDYGISYVVNDQLTLGVAGTEVTESSGGETLDITSVAAQYAIANGLDAYLTYHDYDYAAGTSGATADDGSAILLSLEATF